MIQDLQSISTEEANYKKVAQTANPQHSKAINIQFAQVQQMLSINKAAPENQQKM